MTNPDEPTFIIRKRTLYRLITAVSAVVILAGITIGAFIVGHDSASSRTTEFRATRISKHPRFAVPSVSRPSSPTPTATSPTTTSSVTSPATTTAAPPLSLPGAPPCSGEPNATTPKVRPTELFLACADGNAVVTQITWSSWGSLAAYGTGLFSENQCNPDCAQGTFVSYFNSAVELDDPSNASGTPVFQQVIVTPPGGVSGYTNSSPGAWGWVPAR